MVCRARDGCGSSFVCAQCSLAVSFCRREGSPFPPRRVPAFSLALA